MNRDQAKEHIKSKLQSYLKGEGIDPSKLFKCLNPDHNDKNPSMKYNTERNKVHCFSCGADYDIFNLIGIDYNLNTFPEQFNKACQIFSIPLNEEFKNIPKTEQKEAAPQNVEKDQKEYINKSHSIIGETDYPQQRGLTHTTIDHFKLGYDPSYKKFGLDWKALIIPTTPYSYVVRNIDSKADSKNRYRNEGRSELFNLQALESNNPVFIVEGEIDAMSIHEAEGQAIGLGSTSNKNKLINYFKENPPKQLILIALDHDEAGKATVEWLTTELSKLDISFAIVDILGDYKDPKQALIADKEAFIEKIEKAKLVKDERLEKERIEYDKTSAGANLINFIDGINATADTPSIPTGFKQLDNILDGGLYEGLYIVGAISSLGKTTLITQIADQIAQSGQGVLLFSLEMAQTEIKAKSISRLSLINSKGNIKNAKTTRGITDGKRWKEYSLEEKVAINEATIDYGKYAFGKIFIHEGIGDIGINQIKQAVANHKRLKGNAPVVVIDYLQILAPLNDRATDKQNTDKTVLELKRISRDYKTPVIAISSLNRQSYDERISMKAFKESGAVEYSSDVLIGLQLEGIETKDFNVDLAKQKDPRQIELVILKNRNGKSGDTIKYNYYPAYNYFKES